MEVEGLDKSPYYSVLDSLIPPSLPPTPLLNVPVDSCLANSSSQPSSQSSATPTALLRVPPTAPPPLPPFSGVVTPPPPPENGDSLALPPALDHAVPP